MSAETRLNAPGKKKLLALDGGGIRGALTIEVLAEIEAMLRTELDDDSLLLCEYFDYIGGTSTGAILAASLAIGMSTSELRTFYEKSGASMFEKASLLRRFRYKYEDDALACELKEIFGEGTPLGSDKVRTLLLMVMRNATTDSPWPISNNPRAMFNRTDDDNDNLRLLLWQLIRASTAAPTFFPPEHIQVGEKSFLFVDGGITMFNNPAFQMFLMATLPEYKVEWPTGADKMLVVSVGTGHAPDANKDLGASDMNLLYNAGSVPGALMASALHQQDTLCRVFGRCRVGDALDCEIGDLQSTTAPGGQNLFTYMRYNAELTEDGLAALGLGEIKPSAVQKLDSIAAIKDLQRVGRAVAKSVKAAHYDGFLEPLSDEVFAARRDHVDGLHQYRRREGTTVTAIQLDLETKGFAYEKWGGTQRCRPGDWLLKNGGDVYTVDRETFAATYQQVSPGVYCKNTPVWARQAESAGTIATKEGSTDYKTGDYLVFNDKKGRDGYAMSAEKFRSLYELTIR